MQLYILLRILLFNRSEQTLISKSTINIVRCINNRARGMCLPTKYIIL